MPCLGNARSINMDAVAIKIKVISGKGILPLPNTNPDMILQRGEVVDTPRFPTQSLSKSLTLSRTLSLSLTLDLIVLCWYCFLHIYQKARCDTRINVDDRAAPRHGEPLNPPYFVVSIAEPII
jgi:hypothetical protein